MPNRVFVTVGAAASGDQPVVLLRIARPAVQGNIDAKSTATALIMMAPFVVRSEPEVLALLKPLVTGLDQTTAFAKVIEDLLRAGKSLDSLADDPKAAAAYTAAVEATLAAMAKASQAAGDTKMGALTVAPEESQSQLQVVAGGDALAMVRNWGSRWVTVWAGQPGTDEFLSIVEPAPKTLSLDNVVAVATQGTLWPYEENSLDLTGYGKADLRFYGPGLQPAAAGCTSPGLGDRRLLVPTIATLFDSFLSPAREIVLGLDLAGTKPWQDFLIGLTISLGTDEDLLDAVVSSPVKWGQAAKAVGLASIKQAFNTAMEIGFKTVDTKLGIGKAGPKFASLKTAYAYVAKGNDKDIPLLELTDTWFVHVAASLGMGAL